MGTLRRSVSAQRLNGPWILLVTWAISALGNPLAAQRSPSFDPSSRTLKRTGWSFSAGVHGFSASPDSANSLYQILRPDGSIDTLHSGTWLHQGSSALSLGVGYWGVAQQPIIWDRWRIAMLATRNAATSHFEGWVQGVDSILVPGALADTGRAAVTTACAFEALRSFEILPDFFAEAALGMQWSREWNGTFNRTGPDSLFVPREAPAQNRLALTLGAGVGVRTRTGRYVRIHGNYEAVQLNPFAEEGDGRVEWYDGHYQPWNVALTWDILPPRPAADCAKPPAQDRPGEVLFGPNMEKDREKGRKQQKRRAKKNQRQRW